MANNGDPLERQRLGLTEWARNLRSQVSPLLAQLAPQASAATLETACDEVASAIVSYVRQSEASADVTLAVKRRDLRRMKKSFQDCLDLLDPDVRPFGALLHLRTAQLAQKGLTGNIRDLRGQLNSAVAAVDASLEGLRSRPPHQTDQHQVELAARLRWTLGKTLALRVVMKSEVQLVSAKLGTSANYSRLLRLALTLAGKNPPDDLYYLMKKGRAHLRAEGVVRFEQYVDDDYPDGVAVLTYRTFDTK